MKKKRSKLSKNVIDSENLDFSQYLHLLQEQAQGTDNVYESNFQDNNEEDSNLDPGSQRARTKTT